MTVSDTINCAEHVRDPLDGLVDKTATNPGAPFAPEVLERLAELKKNDRPAFEGLRAQLKKAGCRVAEIDALLAEKFATSDGVSEMFSEVEPWPQPVETAALLRSIAQRLKRHVVFSGNEPAAATALWIAFAWTHEAAVHSPMLLVSSAEMNSGKTTLLGLAKFMLPRAMMIVEISEAVLFRSIAKWSPTLIVDEADVLFKDNPALRAVVNSGWTRGSGVPRCHPETLEPEMFSTFGPKAIGMKGKRIPDTTLGRSILIEMSRKKPSEKAADFEHIDDTELTTIRRHLARWATDNADKLNGARPDMPEGF
jgi:putative DNA primase/helicase